jgi:predicted ribosomally synthesized peptide with nif11-like leader
MSTIKEFKENLFTDAEFSAKFKEKETAEEIVELAKADGFEITVKDINELSDEELSNVAGGEMECIGCGTKKW